MKVRFLFFLLSIALITKGQNDKVITGSIINDSVFVNRGKLGADTNYTNCTFTKSVLFDNARFLGYAVFEGAKFKLGGSFKKSTFYKEANFPFTTFNDDIDFTDARFKGLAYFKETKFYKDASFLSAKFEDNVVFIGTTFHKRIDFVDARFSNSKLMVFRNLVLHDSATFEFYHARLPRIMDFSYTSHIPHEIDLITANFDTLDGQPDVIHTIYLYKSDIPKFHLDYIHFKLAFNDTGAHTTLTPDEIKSVYEQVLKNFKDRGQEISYEKLDIEYQQYKWNAENIWWKKQFGKLIKWWWNYGYCKENVFLHSAYFVLFFTLLNFFILNRLQEVYNVSKIPKTQKFKFKNYAFKEVLVRLWYSFAYTSTIFFKLSIKTEEIEFKHVVRSIYILFIYTLGLVCLAYMANFVLQK